MGNRKQLRRWRRALGSMGLVHMIGRSGPRLTFHPSPARVQQLHYNLRANIWWIGRSVSTRQSLKGFYPTFPTAQNMSFARKYEYFEIRPMMANAGKTDSPLTGQHGHAQSLHAMSPGNLGKAQQLDRVTKRAGESNNQFKRRGAGATGAFLNQVQQGFAVCEALNSPLGQVALVVLDSAANMGKNIRIVLTVAGVKEAGFLPGTLAPHATAVAKGDTNVQTKSTSGVKLILDRSAHATSFHIQTCYPLTDPTTGSWTATEFPDQQLLASG
nr:hypothetical protein [uncultured Noviherbaspirillum sp.]